MALLGQSSIKMVHRYSYATPETMQGAVNKLFHKTAEVFEFRRKAG
jgi:1,2-phenylacetyl-CoA epoxidase catalytic subunit